MHLHPDTCRALIDAATEPALVIDEHLRLIAANAPAEAALRRAVTPGADAVDLIVNIARTPIAEPDERRHLITELLSAADASDPGIRITPLPGSTARLVRIINPASTDTPTYRMDTMESIIHDTTDGIFIFTAANTLSTMNRAVPRLLSLPLCPEELVNASAKDIMEEIAFCLTDPENFIRAFSHATHTPEHTVEINAERFDGVRLTLSARPITSNGETTGSIWAVTTPADEPPITDDAGSAVCSGELARIIETSPARTLLVHRTSGRITAANAAARSAYEPIHGKLTGKPFTSLFAGQAEADNARRHLSRASVDAVSFTAMQTTHSPDEPPAPVTVSAHPVLALSGILYYCSITAMDTASPTPTPPSVLADSLIGAIAHQWRQPLTALSLLLQDIEAAATDGENITEHVGRAVQQVRFMDATVDDFRKLHRNEPANEPVRVLDAVNDVIDLTAPQLTRHGIRINVHVHTSAGSWDDASLAALNAGDIAVCAGSAGELRQALLNIISNARDAIIESRDTDDENAADTRTINVSVTCDTRITIAIDDSGDGICEAMLTRLFEPFTTSRSSGTGIGLSMSRHIIEQRMHGAIKAENRDSGARITITLPRCSET